MDDVLRIVVRLYVAVMAATLTFAIYYGLRRAGAALRRAHARRRPGSGFTAWLESSDCDE